MDLSSEFYSILSMNRGTWSSTSAQLISLIFVQICSTWISYLLCLCICIPSYLTFSAYFSGTHGQLLQFCSCICIVILVRICFLGSLKHTTSMPSRSCMVASVLMSCLDREATYPSSSILAICLLTKLASAVRNALHPQHFGKPTRPRLHVACMSYERAVVLSLLPNARSPGILHWQHSTLLNLQCHHIPRDYTSRIDIRMRPHCFAFAWASSSPSHWDDAFSGVGVLLSVWRIV